MNDAERVNDPHRPAPQRKDLRNHRKALVFRSAIGFNERPGGSPQSRAAHGVGEESPRGRLPDHARC